MEGKFDIDVYYTTYSTVNSNDMQFIAGLLIVTSNIQFA